MNSAMTYYYRLSLLAVFAFLLLVVAQVLWLQKATTLTEQEANIKLQQQAPELALAINSLGHQIFHGDSVDWNAIDLGAIDSIIGPRLDTLFPQQEVDYGFYLEGATKTVHTTALEKASIIGQSTIRSCMSCIISVSYMPDGIADRQEDESDEAYTERLFQEATFQYYAPVRNRPSNDKPNLWVGFHLTFDHWAAARAMLGLFASSLSLLLLLLGLLYYLLQQLNAHKQMAVIKEDFFNNVTHEFKTPLSSIRLASRVLQQGRSSAEKQASYFQLIDKESLALERQIDQLLTLSLLDNEKLDITKEQIDVAACLDRAIERLQPQLDAKKAKVNCQYETGIVIHGNAKHLANCFANLMENSLKYSPDGVDIQLLLWEKNGHPTVIIKDNGPGIPKAIQASLFERFVRGQSGNTYQSKGFGIGLSYVKTMIEAHQGTITLSDSSENGTTFTICFESTAS